MRIIRPEDLHTSDFLIERDKVRVKRELKKYNLMYTGASRFADNVGNTNDAATPLSLVEAGVYIGDTFGSIWITANSRDIFTNGLPVGKRIVMDLVGFFA